MLSPIRPSDFDKVRCRRREWTWRRYPRSLLSTEAVMRVRPMRPKKTTHRAEHRVEDIATKAGKAHSLLVDTVFPYAFGRFLSFLSLGSQLPFWCGAESPAISQWIIGLR